VTAICNNCGKDINGSTPSYSFGLCRNCYRKKTKEIHLDYDPKKVTIFQLYIYEKIKSVCVDTNVIDYSQLKCLLIRSHIPLSIHNHFVNELQGLKMIKKIDRNKIKVYL